MKAMLNKLFNWRLWPLCMKELHEIRRNRKLVAMLIIPPTLNLVLLGFAMNPEVTNLKLGVVDESRTAESREVISAFSESRSFQLHKQYESSAALGEALSAGDLDAGLVIPSDFAKRRMNGETAEIQIIVDGVNSNTAAIAGGYATRIVSALNQKVTVVKGVNGTPSQARRGALSRIVLLYNPGLKNSWFIVTGMIGM